MTCELHSYTLRDHHPPPCLLPTFFGCADYILYSRPSFTSRPGCIWQLPAAFGGWGHGEDDGRQSTRAGSLASSCLTVDEVSDDDRAALLRHPLLSPTGDMTYASGLIEAISAVAASPEPVMARCVLISERRQGYRAVVIGVVCRPVRLLVKRPGLGRVGERQRRHRPVRSTNETWLPSLFSHLSFLMLCWASGCRRDRVVL